MNSPRIIFAVALAGLALAQDANVEGTRQLYYLATPAKDSLPPITHGNAAAPKAAALHFGLRYNVVLIANGKAEQIPANRVLREGDCFAIDLQANRASYLYVLARQSSGSWMPLIPSAQIPGQRNDIQAGKRVRVPTDGYCFSIHNPPGAETLFVVLSRDSRDFYELYESVKAQQTKMGRTELASAKQLDAAVEHLDQKFGGSRDISVTRTSEPARNDEPRGAVYVVNTSDKPSSSLVTKIEVHHR
jgi:Domain of unknown function (DUF4384)